MTSSDEAIVTRQVDVLSAEELDEAIKRWQAPHMVTVSEVDDAPAPMDLAQLEALQQQAQEEGYQSGHSAGYDAGLQQGLAEGQTQIEQRLAELQQILDTLQQPLLDLDEAIENDLVTLAITVAKQVIRRELKQQPEHVIGAMRAALKALPINDRKLKIYVHPDDLELIQHGLSIIKDDEQREWVTDPLLSRGGVRLETADSIIDATVESRLTSVINQMLGEERGAQDESTD